MPKKTSSVLADTNGMVRHTIRLPKTVLQAIREKAQKIERSTSWMMVRILRDAAVK